jgi:hypothetical protein
MTKATGKQRKFEWRRVKNSKNDEEKVEITEMLSASLKGWVRSNYMERIVDYIINKR